MTTGPTPRPAPEPALDLSPAPGAASLPSMIVSQAMFEFKLLMRNGEQLLLTLVVPVALLLGMTSVGWIDLGPGARIDIVTPGILALAVMSTAFTAQAIATGFDRRYGVLKLLGSTPLSRGGLVTAKTLAIIVLEVLQVVIITAIALALHWNPQGNPLGAVALLVLGTAAFSGLALALAGVLRAEATLAVANGIYLLLLFVGGTVIPQDVMPSWLAQVSELLPSGALGGGLRDILLDGESMPWPAFGTLLVWAIVGIAIAARTFKWE